MKKVANFLVEKRLRLFIGSIVAVIACIVLMSFVTINKDMTKYLPKDSSMRAGLDIMNSEFPASACKHEHSYQKA